MDTSRVDGVKAPQHRGTPRSLTFSNFQTDLYFPSSAWPGPLNYKSVPSSKRTADATTALALGLVPVLVEEAAVEVVF